MHHLELIIGLLVVVAALAWLASRISVAYPIVLVVGGLLLATVTRALPAHVQEHLQFDLNPNLVFLIFLPPLLYYAGLLTSWRDFKGNLRPISMLAVGLVLFTMGLVAVAAHHFAGMSWPAAFVLGAIVSPPDAIAATAVTSRLRVPRRIVTILEGESLVNDAAALVAYRIGIAVALGAEQFSIGRATGWFFLAAVGGVAVGLAAGWLVAWMRPRIHDAAVESTISLLTPYIAYLPAEWFHVSGVLSVVTTGIYLSRKLPQVTSPRVRLRAYAIWEAVVFMLNGIIFILIGLQLPTILRALTGTTSTNLISIAAIVSGVCIVARFVWIFVAGYLPRRLFPKLADREPPPPKRAMLVIGWAGMRGIVSLAAALALPSDFPHRDLILFITFGVILATLVVQGLTLPPLIRAMKLPADSDGEDEETTARYLSALAAIERLDGLIAASPVAATEQAAGIARLRAEYDERVAYYSRRLAPVGETADGDDVGDSVAEACTISLNVRREAITAERQMLVRLRDQGVIGDEALRAVQEELDLEESRFE